MYLTQALHRSAATTPNQTATLFGDRQQDFAALIDRVARAAGGLLGLGLAPGDRVAVLALNSDYYIEALFATAWAGGAVNPVNIRWSPAEISYSLIDSDTTVLLVDDTFAPLVPALQEITPCLRTVIDIGSGLSRDMVDWNGLIAASDPIEDAWRHGDDLAGIFYTGGTTGFPKGVMLSHTNLVTAALGGLASRQFFTPGQTPRSLHAAPMFHLADFAFLTATCVAGGTNVVLPAFTPAAVVQAMKDHDVTDTLLVPTMLQMLTGHLEQERIKLPSLQSVLYGASPISGALLDRVTAALPDVRLVQAYGMTETAAIATILDSADHEHPDRRRSAGRPAPTTELRIVDDGGTAVPAGTVGEIAIRGAQVMQGYWNKPDLTAGVLRGEWLHTGDAGYLDANGYLYVVDRLKDMIITGGENVYSAEVENAVAQHPAVAAAAIIGIPDERWGETVHAVLVLHPDQSITLEQVQEHTRSLIAGYKVPRTIETMAALPLSAAGKVLKTELRQTHHR